MFKKVLIIITAFLVVVLAAPSQIFAQANRETRTSRVIKVPSDEVITDDFFIQAGENVEISGMINGDVYIAGGQVVVDGTIDGDLLAAGGTINVSGEVSGNLRVIGGQIVVSGKVGKNATIVGGDVSMITSGQVDGGVVVVGGNLLLSAPVAGDVRVAVGNLTLGGEVWGDVEASLGTFRLTSEANIFGDVTYTSEEDATVDKGASISGQMTRKSLPVMYDESSFSDFSKKARQFDVYSRFLSFLSALVFGLLLLHFFPSCFKGTSKVISQNFFKTAFVGFLTLIVTPFVILLLLVTIVGVPLGFVTIFSYFLFIYLSKIFFSYWLGMKLSERFNIKKPQWIFVLGLSIYFLLRMILIVGWVTALVSVLCGLGAIVLDIQKQYQKLQKAKVA